MGGGGAAELTLAVWALSQSFDARLTEALQPMGLSVAGFRLVGEVMRSPDGLRQSELAQRLGVRAPTVSAAVTRLEGSGVVVRIRDPEDPRAWRVRISEGAPLEHGFDVLRRIDDELADGMSARTRHRLVARLNRLAERLGGAT